jgi:hypothetical protein
MFNRDQIFRRWVRVLVLSLIGSVFENFVHSRLEPGPRRTNSFLTGGLHVAS